MIISEKDLANILKRPGYTVAGVSVWDPQIAQKKTVTSAESRAVSVRWRSEWEFQSAVMAEAWWRAGMNSEFHQPAYQMLVAIPNGQYRKGQRPEAGLTAGLPDLVLLASRGGHGAMFIELKVGKGRLSKAQREMQERLRGAGYRCVTVWDSVDEVFQLIEEYLGG